MFQVYWRSHVCETWILQDYMQSDKTLTTKTVQYVPRRIPVALKLESKGLEPSI